MKVFFPDCSPVIQETASLVAVTPMCSQTCHQHFLLLATVPVLDPAGFIGLHGNGIATSKIDDFSSEPSLYGHKY